ncbi:MAG: hypothetical protein K9I70_04600 [Chitinophagaceae bacterium]|nr:hypothetical protein [Chitinophagaceae bacterium]
MTKQFITFTLAFLLIGSFSNVNAQSKKEKKVKYYQNSEPQPEFDIKGFFIDNEKNEVEKKPVEAEYDVKVSRKEDDAKYRGEKKVGDAEGEEKVSRKERHVKKQKPRNEVEIKMTDNEHEYRTTVVKRRYTNLDVFCDDLDLAKIQRPVFKGICTESSNDVDIIITNKNMSSLEKNYELKTCYMMRDKRLREVLDDDQYRKFLRIKDADEYLILTKDPELKDGIYN